MKSRVAVWKSIDFCELYGFFFSGGAEINKKNDITLKSKGFPKITSV